MWALEKFNICSINWWIESNFRKSSKLSLEERKLIWLINEIRWHLTITNVIILYFSQYLFLRFLNNFFLSECFEISRIASKIINYKSWLVRQMKQPINEIGWHLYQQNSKTSSQSYFFPSFSICVFKIIVNWIIAYNLSIHSLLINAWIYKVVF